MIIKTHYTANFSKKTRLKKDIKIIVIHYTGMQSKIESLKRLSSIKHKVSCHYFVGRNGEILRMVNDKNVAWHAGKSKWKNFKNINYNSLGIELVNKGHKLGYQSFTEAQIVSLIKLCKMLKKKYHIKDSNIVGHSDIAPFRKLDPGEKFPWKRLNKNNLGIWFRNSKLNLNENLNLNSIFFKNLHKIGYRYLNFKERRKRTFLIKAFQRHFVQQKVSGVIDKKTYIISHFLAKNS